MNGMMKGGEMQGMVRQLRKLRTPRDLRRFFTDRALRLECQPVADLHQIQGFRIEDPWPGTFLDQPTWKKAGWFALAAVFVGIGGGYALRMKQDVYRASLPPSVYECLRQTTVGVGR